MSPQMGELVVTIALAGRSWSRQSGKKSLPRSSAPPAITQFWKKAPCSSAHHAALEPHHHLQPGRRPDHMSATPMPPVKPTTPSITSSLRWVRWLY